MLTFPLSLPAPNRDSFTRTKVPVVERGTGEQGDVRSRLRSLSKPWFYDVEWDLDEDEQSVFWNFYEWGLNDGADKFYWPVFNGNAFYTRRAQFVSEHTEAVDGRHGMTSVRARLYVTGPIGPVAGYTISAADANTTITFATLAGFTPVRTDVYVRTAFDGPSPVVYAGWTNIAAGGTIAELVEAAPMATAGQHHIVKAGSSYAGSQYGTLQASSTDVKVRFVVTGTPTVGSASVAFTYE